MLLGLMGAFIAVIFLTLALVWFYPGIFIHETTVKRFVLPQVEQKGFRVRYDNLIIMARSQSFWKKSLLIESKNLCVDMLNEGENCFPDLKIDSVFDLSAFSLTSFHIEELHLLTKKLRVRIPPEENKENEPSTLNTWALLKKITLNKIFVEVSEFIVRTSEDRYSGQLKIENSQSNAFSLKADVESEKKTTLEKAFVDLSREHTTKLLDLLNIAKANISAQLAGKKNVKLEAKREATQLGARFDIKALYNGAPVKADIGMALEHKQNEIKGSVSGLVLLKQLRGPIRLSGCDFQIALPEKQKEESLAFVENGSFLCKFGIRTHDLVTDQKYLSSLPKQVDFLFSAHVKKEKNTLGNEELLGGVKLEVGPVSSALLDGRLLAHYEINFSSDDENSKIDFDPIKIESDLLVKDFESLAKILNSTSLVVPSPVNVLKGAVTLKGQGELRPSPLSGFLELALVTKLAAGQQALDLNAEGRLTFEACEAPKENTFVSLDLKATQMKLRLPNIDYKKPPVIMPDSRFVLNRKEPAKASACPLAYKFDFQNVKNPIFILSDFLKKDLPLHMDVHAQNGQDVNGKISISNYSTQLFKRNATIENFLLDLKTKELTSRVRVDYADYKIFILLSGTTQSVQLNLESDPPMSRDQAFAVLLFGKPLEGLEPDETGSVRNADAAAKDGALTLASLYIFASTPIESVGYNPHTNGLVTKVKLGDGTTLNVGANAQGLTDTSLTRRLSKHWRIQTTVQEPQEENRNRSASTLLEWFHRF